MPPKQYRYELKDSRNENAKPLIILSNIEGHQAKPYSLFFPADLDISYGNGKLYYYTGRPGKASPIFTIKISEGKPYDNTLTLSNQQVTATITSKDQETFTITFK